MNKAVYQELPILISSRIRLNEEQRSALRSAYRDAHDSYKSPVTTTTTGLQVTTATSGVDLDRQLGVNSLVFSDLIASRDSIAIAIILRFQEVLGVEVVTKKQCVDACKSYVDYIFDKHTRARSYATS